MAARWVRKIKKYGRAFTSMLLRSCGEYTLCFPHLYYTYSPWNLPAFQSWFATIRGNSLVSADRCHILMQAARQACALDGDFAECGVFKGGTAWLLATVLTDAAAAGQGATGAGKTLLLFDTFEGMPWFADRARDGHAPRDFANTSLRHVRDLLRPFDMTEIRQGVIPDTFAGCEHRRFSFVHVDVDLYPSTLSCLEFFYSRMVSGGIIICDDYGFEGYEQAARAAVDEFFERRPEVPLVLPTGQCLIIKV